MYKCPKCKNFASVGPGICWKCGATLQAERTVVVLRLPEPLRIRNAANADVTGGYRGVIGGREQWTVTAPNNPHAVVSNLAIHFSVLGAAIGNYVADGNSAVLTPFVCLPSSAAFYWGQVGVIQVTVEATVLGQRAREQFNITVVSPTLNEFTALITSSEVRTEVPRYKGGVDPERFTISALSFGRPSPRHQGIAFTVRVTLADPSLAGEITMTQILKVKRRKTLASGHFTVIESPGFVLDRAFHYGFDSPAVDDEDDEDGPLAVSAGQYRLTTGDSPSSNLGYNGDRREITHVDIDEEFRMYVMYRPTNGVWVALGEITWYWSAIAIFNTLTNRFVYQPGLRAMANVQLLPNLLFVRFPLWSENVETYLSELA